MKKVTWPENLVEPIIKRVCDCQACLKCFGNCKTFGQFKCEECKQWRCKKCIIVWICRYCKRI
jgi:hypothetical protein